VRGRGRYAGITTPEDRFQPNFTKVYLLFRLIARQDIAHLGVTDAVRQDSQEANAEIAAISKNRVHLWNIGLYCQEGFLIFSPVWLLTGSLNIHWMVLTQNTHSRI